MYSRHTSRTGTVPAQAGQDDLGFLIRGELPGLALLRLGRADDAGQLVDALCRHVTPYGLQAGCYHRRTGLAVANELVWGDFHLLEALLGLAGELDPLAY